MVSDNSNNNNTNGRDETKAKFKCTTISASNLKIDRKQNINRLVMWQLNVNS